MTVQIKGVHLTAALRRDAVARLLIRKWRKIDIAKKFKVSPSTISIDVKVIHKQFIARLGEAADQLKAEQLAALDEAERENWINFQKSTGLKKKLVDKNAGDPEKSFKSITKWRETGDPRYLSNIVNIIKERSELLGLKAPTQVEIDQYIIDVRPATIEDAEKIGKEG